MHHPVSLVPGIGPAYTRILESRGIFTVGELLLHFPASYIDTSAVSRAIRPSEPRLYRVRIDSLKLSRLFHRHLSLVKIQGRIGRQALQVTFFNMPYMADQLQDRKEMLVFGCAQRREEGMQIVNPQWIPPEWEKRILPTYSPIGSLTSGRLRRIISAVCQQLQASEEPLPPALVRRHSLPDPVAALSAIHTPLELPPPEGAVQKKRFIYTEFLLYHLEIQAVRRHFGNRPRLQAYHYPDSLRQAISSQLPFPLTGDQERVFEEIVGDLLSPRLMTRLLHGEVGSGKTILAFLALQMTTGNGYQGAFLAPTEILACQHHANACRFFKGINPLLLTGSTPAAQRQQTEKALEKGEAPLVFGTHALLQQEIRFHRLGLVVIDEQHRFGVAQRAALYCKGRSVDLLVTTATPIPRTLQLALFRDMDVSELSRRGLPRAEIKTRIVPAGRRDSFYRWLQERIRRGEKGYVVLPLIERSEFFGGLRSLEEEKPFYRSLFKGIPWAVVTGRHAAEEKRSVLDRLRRGRVRVLVATTVIEVGVDVPDATFMVIENADRYGLAQLHQMRGRVGRGERPSACYLLSSPLPTARGLERLRAMVQTDDGFRIAEMDLEMRGGGNIAGTQQYGDAAFRCGDPDDHLELYQAAEADAAMLLADPGEQTPLVRDVLDRVERKIGSLSFS